MEALENSHSKLLEISELYLENLKPSSMLGLEVSKTVLEARQIKKSTAATADL